jgi:predicted PurR-regulated permease PerM
MVVLGVLGALAVIAIFRLAPGVMAALGIGLLVALALDPVLRATQARLGCSRAVGTTIIGGALAIALVAIVVLLAPQAADQAGQLTKEAPATVEDMYSWPVVGHWLQNADAASSVERFVNDLPERINADSIENAAGRLLGGLGAALVVLITAVSVLLDGEALVARVRRWLPEGRRARADEIGRIVYQSVARFFAGSIAVAVLNGLVILTAGLLLGVPLAPLAAIWAAITNLIPQIGGFLGGSFFVLLATTQGALTGLIALAVFLAYQQLENHLIQPTVIGRAVDLTPPTTMLAALIGGAAAGVPGALVATPLVGAAKSVWRDVRGETVDEGDEGDEGDESEHDERSPLSRLRDRLQRR